MNSPAVSIIVPVYKTPIVLLQRFLRSALRQTLGDIEVIMVDDASPDECPQVLDDAAAGDERIRIIHRSENGRAGVARGQGKDIARGQYVLFADADDVMQADMCEVLLGLASKHAADVVACSWCARDPNGHVVGRGAFPDHRYDLHSDRDREKCYRTLNYALWNKLFRYDVIAPLRFEQFEANIGEDLLFNIAALCRSRSMVTTSYVGYEYTVHTTSATGRAAKGMSYLRTLAISGARIKETLVTAEGGVVNERYADRLLLKRYSIGCGWIAEHPDPNERAAMWAYWQDYFRMQLRPSLKTSRVLSAWYHVITALCGASRAYRLTQLANRVVDPMSVVGKLRGHHARNRSSSSCRAPQRREGAERA